jgi:hypothetical protein
VGGRAQLLELLGGEDVDGDQVDLGVTVLAGLGGGHFDDLAGAVLDADESVLPQRGALHGVRGRGAGIGALEGVLMLWRMRLAGVRDGDCGRRRAAGGLRARRRRQQQRRGTVRTSAHASPRTSTYLRVVGFGHCD